MSHTEYIEVDLQASAKTIVLVAEKYTEVSLVNIRFLTYALPEYL